MLESCRELVAQVPAPSPEAEAQVVPSNKKLTLDPGNQAEACSAPRSPAHTGDSNSLSRGLFLRKQSPPFNSMDSGEWTVLNNQPVTSIAHSQHRAEDEDASQQ